MDGINPKDGKPPARKPPPHVRLAESQSNQDPDPVQDTSFTYTAPSQSSSFSSVKRFIPNYPEDASPGSVIVVRPGKGFPILLMGVGFPIRPRSVLQNHRISDTTQHRRHSETASLPRDNNSLNRSPEMEDEPIVATQQDATSDPEADPYITTRDSNINSLTIKELQDDVDEGSNNEATNTDLNASIAADSDIPQSFARSILSA
ncbi:hypothetical protein ACA910_020949 [Epithemia clementina (nom. ined.)]